MTDEPMEPDDNAIEGADGESQKQRQDGDTGDVTTPEPEQRQAPEAGTPDES